MNRFSIPAFVDELVQDNTNAKYSKAKLKMYYVGETGDKRLFTKEFSDKLISKIAYTPVVGFFSVADDDFVGHNNVQHIYGIVPADATVEYVLDESTNTTFAVTDIILYTGRPDEIGAVASKIVGKQHSLELDPNTVKYKINRDSAGNFKNLEYTEGELIGLSVLGDNETPAFAGSEFFSAAEMPNFITSENKSKYQTLFNAIFRAEPTAEEGLDEIYNTLANSGVYGYVCEHILDKYVVISVGQGVYHRYLCSRNEQGELVLTFDAVVRPRFLSDSELETISNMQKGSAQNNDTATENNTNVGASAAASDNSSASADNGSENLQQEIETLRVNCERLQQENASLNEANASIENNFNALQHTYAEHVNIYVQDILNRCSDILENETIEYYKNNYSTFSPAEFLAALAKSCEEQKQNTQNDIIEINTIDTTFTHYDECDEVSVVTKYLRK